MNPTEVFNASLRVYRQLGWTYLRLTVVPSTFCLAGIAFVLQYVLPSFLVTHNAASTQTQLGEAAFALILALAVGGPLFLIGFSYTSALVINLASDYMLGNQVSADSAVDAARQSLGALMVVSLRELFLASAGTLVGAVLLGIGGYLSSTSGESVAGGIVFVLGCLGIGLGFGLFLYVLSIHSLAPAIIQIEGLGGSKAAKRSAYLLRPQLTHPGGAPNFLICMVYIGCVALVEWAGISAIFEIIQAARHVEGAFTGLPFESVFVGAFSLVAPFVTIWTLLPIYATCITLVYYERRIRLEGLDIEILAAETLRAGSANRFDV